MADDRKRLLSVFLEQQDSLRRFLASRLGNRELAEDLAQETWLRAHRGGDLAIENPKSYLFRIAANLAIDHQRRQARGIEVSAPESVTDRIAASQPSPESVARDRQELARLQAALETLPPRCRQVFLLARIEALTYREIGERLGISPKTAFSHLVKALSLLQARMDAGGNEGERS